MRSSRNRHGSEEGAVLVIALLVITTIALVTGALLSKGSGNFLATVSLRKVAGSAYASDAAAKMAINDLVLGETSGVPGAAYPAGTPHGWVYDNNSDGSGCFGKDAAGGPLDRITIANPATQPAGSGPLAATVVCSPVLGTGLFGSGNGTVVVQPSSSDPFARALTTVGTGTVNGATDGMALKPLGNNGGPAIMPIRGAIASNSSIAVTNGTVQTNSTVSANGTCTTTGGGKIVPGCSGTMTVLPPPSSPIPDVPGFQDPASAHCDFPPGYYSSGAALTAAVNACPLAHFQSGKYYFDFVDGKPWDISTRVVGGETVYLPNGAVAGTPGACVSPVTVPGHTGVQFVFGGSSAIKLEDTAVVELCGPSNGGAAPLTIYQQQTGTSPPAVPAGPFAPHTSADAGSGNKADPFFPSPATSTLSQAVSASGGSSAQWKSSGSKHTGELDLQDFAGLSSIPRGSTITSATLRVNYTRSAGFGGSLTAAIAGQSPTAGVGVPDAATNWSPPVDLTAQLNSQFGSAAVSATVPTIQLQVGGNTANNDSLAIDVAQLNVSYTVPALHAASTGPFIFQQGGNFAGQFVVQGATFAPNGYIVLTPGTYNGSGIKPTVAFHWGLVAWGVNFQSQPSQPFGFPLASIPDVGYGLGSAVTAVDLKVYVCSGAGPCNTSGNPSLTSRVQFTDKTTSQNLVDPVPGARQVKVLSWSEQR